MQHFGKMHEFFYPKIYKEIKYNFRKSNIINRNAVNLIKI